MLVRLWAVAVMAAVCSCGAAEVAIEISADPPLPVANLFVNPGLEEGDARPEGWGVAASQPDVVDFDYPKTGGHQGAYLRVDAEGSTSNGYLSQPLSVLPDTLYRAGAWVRIRGGTMVMWLHAWVDGTRFDERAYLKSYGSLPLIPDFVKIEWTTSPDPEEWIWVGREFRTWPDQGNVNPHFGAYFSRGSMDLDDPFIGLARTTLSVRATGPGLAQVKVANEAGNEVFVSDKLAEGTAAFEHELPELPTDARYCVSVTTTDGEVAERWYPEANE